MLEMEGETGQGPVSVLSGHLSAQGEASLAQPDTRAVKATPKVRLGLAVLLPQPSASDRPLFTWGNSLRF